MSQPNWNRTVTGRLGVLGIVLGLGLVGGQIPNVLLTSGGLDNTRAVVFPIIIMGIGVTISVLSYLTIMNFRYETSCIIPPEWKSALTNEHESPVLKILIILYMIQLIFLIPVVVSSMALCFIKTGWGAPWEVYVFIILSLFFVLCGSVLFSHFFKNRKVGDS